jgi:hypothetical protein
MCSCDHHDDAMIFMKYQLCEQEIEMIPGMKGKDVVLKGGSVNVSFGLSDSKRKCALGYK